MGKFQFKLFILGALLVTLGHLGLSQQRATTLFAEKLSQAKRLLADLPTGWNFAVGLETYGTYINAINIQPQPASFLRAHNLADGGGIAKNKNGEYEIYINPDVSVERMAHTLAHELQHIRDEMVADQILRQHQALKNRINETVKWIRDGQAQKAAAERRLETNYVMQALFCTEYRAHTLNLVLQQEGLGDFFLSSQEHALAHIENGYIRRHGFKISAQDVEHLTETCAYQKMPQQSSPMQTLLETSFPAVGKDPS